MRSIIIFIGLLVTQLVVAQETIHGRVTDAINNEPLTGATVMSGKDTTVTDQGGYFSLKASQLPADLQIQFLGYQSFYTAVKNNSGIVRIAMAPSALALNEVIITSGIQENKIRNIAGSVDLISKGMLRRDDPFTLTESLNRIPGVYMHSGTYNTNRITIRGVGSRSPYGTTKIKAYYDQIPLTDGSGNSSIEDIDQSLIDRVEIVKGPNSSLYGAGLAGVVKLYSYQPESNQTSLESSLTLGSYKTRRWMNRFSHNDENKSITLTYSKMKSAGYRENSEYNRDQIGITSRYYLNENNYLSFLGVYTGLKAYIPSSINEEAFRNNPESAAFTWAQAQGFEQYDKGLFGISYSSEFSVNWKLTSSLFFKFRDAYEPRPFDILDENTTSLGTRNTVTYQLEKITVSAGMELFRDNYEWGTYENLYDNTTNGSVQGQPLSDNEEDRNYSNFFVESTYNPIRALSIVAGLNLNYTNYRLSDDFTTDDVDQSGDYSFDPVLSPRIGISYQISPATNFYLNASHGFSPPGLDETLYPDGQINTDIQPEMGWNYEAGLRGNVGRFNYDASFYLMKIKDLLVAQRIGQDQYVGVNAGLNTHLGLDLYTNYFLPITRDATLNFFNSLSWMNYEFTDFTNEGNDYSGNQLTGVPKITVNPGIELISETGFYGNINGRYVGKIPINDANTLYSEKYFILRTKIGYQIKLSNWEFDLNAGVNNLTDERYASMLLINATGFGGSQPRYYYPGLPRNYFGGLAVKYVF